MSRALVYGGCGSLGRVCVEVLKKKGIWVCSVGFTENTAAEHNIILRRSDNVEEQHEHVHEAMGLALNGHRLDGIFCVAGGWAGGNAAKKDFVKSCELVWKQSVLTSCIAASVASEFLVGNGVVVFTGAECALSPTPNMIGYGMAKCAVHHLIKSLASKSSGISAEASVFGILPMVLDTPQNRSWMPKADQSTWTPLESIAEFLSSCLESDSRPLSGSLLKVVTKDKKTEFIPV